MNHFNKIFLSAVTFLFLSKLASGQPNEIKINYIGNCGLYMTDGNFSVCVDFPYKSGAFNYMKYDKSVLDSIREPSIFIFTHRHPDHYSRKLLKKFHGKVYGPWKVAKKRRLDPEKLSDSLKYFSIQAFKTKHRFAAKHSSYLITWHTKRIYISGDTESADTIGKISNMDWAFVPSWILIDAKEKNMKIDTKKFALYHLYPTEEPNVKTPDRIILMKTQKEVISIPY